MSSYSAEAMARLQAMIAAAANNPNAASTAASMAASMAASSTTTNPASSSTTTAASSRRPSSTSEEDDDKKKANQNEEQEDDEEEITYTPYKPSKLQYGKPHPDKVVENSTLSAVAPPDIHYNMVMPANIIYEGKLSNSQLEAIVYGCQRHMVDLPKPKIVTAENDVPEAAGAAVTVKSEKKGLQVEHESKPQADSPALSPCPSNSVGTVPQPPVARKIDPPSYRAGFLLGDGAGMVRTSMLSQSLRKCVITICYNLLYLLTNLHAFYFRREREELWLGLSWKILHADVPNTCGSVLALICTRMPSVILVI